MARYRITIGEEVYISLEGLAACYQVEIAWVREVYDIGLLGQGRATAGTIAVEICMLDRFATIRRLHLQAGLDPETIALFILTGE